MTVHEQIYAELFEVQSRFAPGPQLRANETQLMYYQAPALKFSHKLFLLILRLIGKGGDDIQAKQCICI